MLGEHYRVIAPDHLGFGLSDAPPAAEFEYTFDALADLTSGLLRELGVERYTLYVQDYGARSAGGWPCVHPDAITGIITQNGNGYDAGFVEGFWRDGLELQARADAGHRGGDQAGVDS